MQASLIKVGGHHATGSRRYGRLYGRITRVRVEEVVSAPVNRYERRKAFDALKERTGATGWLPRSGGSFIVCTIVGDEARQVVVSAKDVLGTWAEISAEEARNKADALAQVERSVVLGAEREQAAQALRSVCAFVGVDDVMRVISRTQAPAVLALVRALATADSPWRMAVCDPAEPQAWVVVSGAGAPISKPLGRIQAEHMLAELHAASCRMSGRNSECSIVLATAEVSA